MPKPSTIRGLPKQQMTTVQPKPSTQQKLFVKVRPLTRGGRPEQGVCQSFSTRRSTHHKTSDLPKPSTRCGPLNTRPFPKPSAKKDLLSTGRLPCRSRHQEEVYPAQDVCRSHQKRRFSMHMTSTLPITSMRKGQPGKIHNLPGRIHTALPKLSIRRVLPSTRRLRKPSAKEVQPASSTEGHDLFIYSI